MTPARGQRLARGDRHWRADCYRSSWRL